MAKKKAKVEMQTDAKVEVEAQVKKKMGRPKGSYGTNNKYPRKQPAKIPISDKGRMVGGNLGRALRLEEEPEILERLNEIVDGGLSDQDRLIRGLSSGIPIALACQYAGIHPTRWYEWLKLEKEDPESLHPNVRAFIAIALKFKAAKAVWAQEQWFATAGGEKKGRWEGFATYLERQHPEYYSQQRKSDKENNTTVINNIQTIEAEQAAEKYATLAAEYRQITTAKDIKPIEALPNEPTDDPEN